LNDKYPKALCATAPGPYYLRHERNVGDVRFCRTGIVVVSADRTAGITKMPLEIEIKLKVESHETVVGRLRELGAAHAGTVRETNVFFDRPDGSLRQADCGLRVRFTVPLGAADPAPGAAKEPAALLTFKGPAGTTGLRSREAFDLRMAPPDQVLPLLAAMGFRQVFRFEKNRESWRLGGCLVELDVLPHFGSFLEIEGPSEEAVRAVQEQLGLGQRAAHEESYARMVGGYLKGRGETELRFGAGEFGTEKTQ
jgi:adenylate cyclase, class 2